MSCIYRNYKTYYSMKTFKFIAAICGVAALACGCEKEETKTEEVAKEPVKVETVTLDKSSLNLVEEQEALLVATFSPAETEVGAVVWASSNDKVASVSQEGKVSALAPGDATISVAAGDVKAECKVTVTKRIIKVTQITLSATELNLEPGGEAQLTATYDPADADLSSVVWASSAEAVATVSQDGKVNAVADGVATISVTAGAVKAVCQVTVQTPAKEWAVGDYYEVGSVKGVVVWVDESKLKGKIISLDEAETIWSTGLNYTGAQSRTDGKSNTEKVKSKNPDLSEYPAFKWCVDHGNGWYLPAIEEVYYFLKEINTIAPTLAAHGGKELDCYYWSSTENEENSDSSAITGYGYKGNNVSSEVVDKNYTTDPYFVRAMYQF